MYTQFVQPIALRPTPPKIVGGPHGQAYTCRGVQNRVHNRQFPTVERVDT